MYIAIRKNIFVFESHWAVHLQNLCFRLRYETKALISLHVRNRVNAMYRINPILKGISIGGSSYFSHYQDGGIKADETDYTLKCDFAFAMLCLASLWLINSGKSRSLVEPFRDDLYLANWYREFLVSCWIARYFIFVRNYEIKIINHSANWNVKVQIKQWPWNCSKFRYLQSGRVQTIWVNKTYDTYESNRRHYDDDTKTQQNVVHIWWDGYIYIYIYTYMWYHICTYLYTYFLYIYIP